MFLLSHCSVSAQEEWTKSDSTRLAKMLNGEIPVRINENFKRELEQSFTAPRMDDVVGLNRFIVVKPEKKVLEYPKFVKPDFHIRYRSLQDSLQYKRAEFISTPHFRISSAIDYGNPLFNIKRETNISFPLNPKLHISVYGSYVIDRKYNFILPVISTTYQAGAGLLYNVNKHVAFKTHASYYYDAVLRRWDWFFGLGFSIKF